MTTQLLYGFDLLVTVPCSNNKRFSTASEEGNRLGASHKLSPNSLKAKAPPSFVKRDESSYSQSSMIRCDNQSIRPYLIRIQGGTYITCITHTRGYVEASKLWCHHNLCCQISLIDFLVFWLHANANSNRLSIVQCPPCPFLRAHAFTQRIVESWNKISIEQWALMHQLNSIVQHQTIALQCVKRNILVQDM